MTGSIELDASVMIRLILLSFLLLFSFLFSGSEAAFFSLRDEEVKDKNFYPFTLVAKIIEDREALLTTVLFGNEIVNIAFSAIMANLFMDLFGNEFVAYAFFISFFVLLNFGEFLPKVLAVRYNHLWVVTSAPLILILIYITYPLRFIVYVVSKGISSLIKDESENIELLMDHATESGVIDVYERDMIKEALAFTELTAKDVMTPEPYIFMLDLKWDEEEMLKRVKACYYSKIPVYEESRDNVLGYVKMTDLISLWFSEGKIDVKKILRPVHFVPETRSIVDLIDDFRKLRLELVMVVDEYGSVTGLVTIEDIIEEIVGDISNEFEERKEYIEVVGKNSFLVGGLTKIEDLKEYVDLPENEELPEVDTVGGLVLHLFGRIPMEGTVVELGNITFKVTKMEGKRIKEVWVEVREDNEISGSET
ncbi:MAG: hemolysin family protein [Thermosulfidibacteraceae bacterium]